MTLITDLDGLLKDIMAAPGDDTPRRIYADWLLDAGDNDRAEFIRLQLDAAALPEGNPQRTSLNEQANTLLAAHRPEWERPLRDLGVTEVGWERGFPSRITIPAGRFITDGGRIIATAPITGATVSDLITNQVANFAASPHLKNLTHLDLGWNNIRDAGAQALAASPHLTNLTRLHLAGNQIGDAGAQALADSSQIKNLTRLDLGVNWIGDIGARSLAGNPHLKNLTRLELGANRIGAAGAQALAGSLHLKNLTHLSLRRNQIGDIGAQALAGSPHLSSLSHLDLAGNQIGERVLAQIARTIAGRARARPCPRSPES